MSRLHLLRPSVVNASVVAIMIVAALAPCSAQESSGCGKAVNGLQLCLTHKTGGQFQVELRNVGRRDLALNLGMKLHEERYPNAVQLLLDDEKGLRRLEAKGPAYVAGILEAFIIPLRVGASLSLPIELRQYWSPETHENEITPTGRYTLRAQYTGKPLGDPDLQKTSPMPYWTGTVQSAPFRSGE